MIMVLIDVMVAGRIDVRHDVRVLQLADAHVRASCLCKGVVK